MTRALLPLAALTLCACAQQVVVYPDGGPEPSDAATADGSPSIDSGVRSDAGVGADSGSPDGDDAGALACTGDPFDTCEDPDEPNGDRNDQWIDADRYASSVGCLAADDTVTELSQSKAARMCPTDRGDFYGLTIVPCDTATLRLQVRLRMREACPADRYELQLLFGGGVRECGSEFDGELVRCTEDGGDRLIQLLIPPGNSVQSWYFAVLTHADDVLFDYDLEVSVR